MISWQKKYPPYEGEEAYLYFVFAEADARKAWRVMKILLRRGCRVWYCMGSAGNSRELLRRQTRASGAALTLLYLSDALEADKDSKTRIMVNQKNQKALLCLNADGKNHNLAMDIHESTPSIPLHQMKNDEELESALIRAKGFTQNMLDKPIAVGNNLLGRLTAVFFLLTVLLIGGGILYSQRSQARNDSIVFSDPVIREAARAAVGGGALTEDSLEQIQAIRLKKLPETWEDLPLMPSLQSIEVPQTEILKAKDLPGSDYRIALYGGAS